MKNCNTIRTSEDKANFIASNMTLESKGFNSSGVLMFECYFDTVVYTVVKVEIYDDTIFFKESTRTCYTDRFHARVAYGEEYRYLKKCADNINYVGKVTIALIENKLSFNVTISVEDLNVSTLASMFDEHLFKYCTICTKAQNICSKAQLDRTI